MVTKANANSSLLTKRLRSSSSEKINIVILTMDGHLTSAAYQAGRDLAENGLKIDFKIFSASEWCASEKVLKDCLAAIEKGDLIIASMLFMEDHFKPVREALAERRSECQAMVCIMSAPEISSLTLMGRLDMSKPSSGPLAFLKRFRKKSKSNAQSSGANQMRMLRRLPKILKYIPGTAQDLRMYLLTLQYWLAGSQDNIFGLVCNLIDKYLQPGGLPLNRKLEFSAPKEYPELGVYHPRIRGRIGSSLEDLPRVVPKNKVKGVVGLLMLRSYLLAGNTAHYDGVIAALEAQGLEVVPAFAMGLDSRPAINKFHMCGDKSRVDVLISLTGFSLVGGPAYNDSAAAISTLKKLNVPYISAHPLEFQTLNSWKESKIGLLPVETTIMVAIPELDGAMSPMVYGGRKGEPSDREVTDGKFSNSHDMAFCSERVSLLSEKVVKLVALKRKRNREKRVAVVLFNFPPNAGNVGTAAHLDVFESLFNTLTEMHRQGYDFRLPRDSEELKKLILEGNAKQFGQEANIANRTPVDKYISELPWLEEVEKVWGVAPGKQLTDGHNLFVLGVDLGNIFVGVQPAFGFEGDPMRLLFEKGHAPTHAFCNFYRFLKDEFSADAILHFGTHGALEFMPGKQSGMTDACWPDRLISSLPNFNLYASNNPSEGTLAKRRASAVLLSYLTPPVCEAGLYKSLGELKAMIESYCQNQIDSSLNNSSSEMQACSTEMIISEAKNLDLLEKNFELDILSNSETNSLVIDLKRKLNLYESTLIPHGLHILGGRRTTEQRLDLLGAVSKSWLLSKLMITHHHTTQEFENNDLIKKFVQEINRSIVNNLSLKEIEKSTQSKLKGLLSEANIPEVIKKLNNEDLSSLISKLMETDRLVENPSEIYSIISSLNGDYIMPAPGGDVIRNPDILPTGRNIHGFDPFRLPSSYAVLEGANQAELLLKKATEDSGKIPETIAMVLWGTDNLKTEGSPLSQVFRLLGTRPRFDTYGRLVGAELIPLTELGRPRIDVMVTLSGIFRDLLPLQIKALAEAAFIAASADEPLNQNFIRAHAQAYCKDTGCGMKEASLRVFGNSEGTYGANVNHLIHQGCWDDESELAAVYSKRKGFAYGLEGKPVRNDALLKSVLSKVDLAYQNLDSIEVGITTIDTYFDTLGGLSKAVRESKGLDEEIPVYIGDQTSGAGVVRNLSEQVALETRTRVLNPKWYEGMLDHGFEGVRQIEAQLTHTLGWSATTGQVQPWVYQKMTETFILDDQMRNKLTQLNPTASARVVNRLLEASKRNYWRPSNKTLASLEKVSQDLEDKLEGVTEGVSM